MSVVGVVADELMTTSFSSENTFSDFAGSLGVALELLLSGELFLAASLARLPNVGILAPPLLFLTSMGRAVTFRATIELLVVPKLGVWGTCGVLELGVVPLEGVVAPDFTLTTLA